VKTTSAELVSVLALLPWIMILVRAFNQMEVRTAIALMPMKKRGSSRLS
jgi:hypothetical protein